jgi:hypothetical protein
MLMSLVSSHRAPLEGTVPQEESSISRQKFNEN